MDNPTLGEAMGTFAVEGLALVAVVTAAYLISRYFGWIKEDA
jgi:hypothetical protein